MENEKKRTLIEITQSQEELFYLLEESEFSEEVEKQYEINKEDALIKLESCYDVFSRMDNEIEYLEKQAEKIKKKISQIKTKRSFLEKVVSKAVKTFGVLGKSKAKIKPYEFVINPLKKFVISFTEVVDDLEQNIKYEDIPVEIQPFVKFKYSHTSDLEFYLRNKNHLDRLSGEFILQKSELKKFIEEMKDSGVDLTKFLKQNEKLKIS